MEHDESCVVEGAKENGANDGGNLEPLEHCPCARDVDPLRVLVPLSVAECKCSSSNLLDVPKEDARTDHPAMDAKLDPSPSASMQVIDDVLAPKDKKIEYPKEIILLQDQRAAEWSFYPRGGNLHTYHKGKKCHFNGIFLANQRCSTEISLAKCFGSKKYGINLRNGLPQLSPGDKPYFRSEQSSDFYKLGSSMPLVNFSRKPYTKKVDTFIPLEPLPKERHLPFSVREKRKQKLNEIMEVEKLDSWNPAVPILTWLFPPLPIQKRVVVI